jgi:antirestriction protein ArdC
VRLSGAEAAFLHIIDTSRLVQVLKQDRREIFHAAAEAQRIADYILAFHPDYAEKPGDPADEDDVSIIAAPLAA